MTFHSLEDRIVKQTFKDLETELRLRQAFTRLRVRKKTGNKTNKQKADRGGRTREKTESESVMRKTQDRRKSLNFRNLDINNKF